MNSPRKTICGHTGPFLTAKQIEEAERQRESDPLIRQMAKNAAYREFSQPDVAAPRSTAVPGVLRPEVHNPPGINDIGEPQTNVDVAQEQIERLDRIIADLQSLCRKMGAQ